MKVTAVLDEAKLAFDREDYGATLDAAERAIQTNARSVKAWRLKMAALRKMGKADLAEAVSLEAMQTFPDADWPLGEHAQAAATRGDIAEAMRRFDDLRLRFPQSVAGFAGAIRLARNTSQDAMADTLLKQGLKRLPGNEQLARLQRGQSVSPRRRLQMADVQASVVDYRKSESALAEILKVARRDTQRKANRALALSMFQKLHDGHPDYAPGYAAHIECLLQADRAADAASLAGQVGARFPDHFAFCVAAVKAFSEAGQFGRALSLVADMRDRFADAPALRAVHIHVLTDSGQESAAESLANEALSTWPREPGLWREYARTATRRGDWTAALDRWLQAQQQRPDDKSIARQIDLARSQLCIAVPPEASSSVFGRFESLGGEPLGCEFGMVQRDEGADSVGLLRWAAISHAKLIEALDSDLEGFGSQSQTELTEVTEYYGLRDTRYGLFTHTFVKRADAPHDKMFLQSCRRMRFLADKLREELSAGDKIFVYKSAAALPDEELTRLHDAVIRRGGNMLLCLLLASEHQAAGSVRSVQPNLFAGYVGYFMNGEPGKHSPRFDLASYREICSQTAAAASRAVRSVVAALP